MLSGRIDDDGLIQLEVQDRSKWDRDLIGRGFLFLEKSSIGNELSEYHLEAGIASLRCAAPTYEEDRNGPKSWDFTTCCTG